MLRGKSDCVIQSPLESRGNCRRWDISHREKTIARCLTPFRPARQYSNTCKHDLLLGRRIRRGRAKRNFAYSPRKKYWEFVQLGNQTGGAMRRSVEQPRMNEVYWQASGSIAVLLALVTTTVAAQTADESSVAEVVVTARRRAESIQNVPES